MPIRVSCPNCGTTLNAPDTAAGKMIKCPKCEAICSVPLADHEGAAPAVIEPPPPLPHAASRIEYASREELQRGPRRDAHEIAPNTGVQFGFGIAATVLGAIALCFSFIPCCGLPFALALGGIGLICGGVGVVAALVAERRGLTLPAVGSGLCVLAMLIGAAWYAVIVGWAAPAAEQYAKGMEKHLKKQLVQQQKLLDEAVKQQEEAAKKGVAKVAVLALENAVSTFLMNKGRYPETLKQLTQSDPTDNSPAILNDARLLVDPWDNTYIYERDTRHPDTDKPLIYSNGPPGENQRISNWD